MQARSRFTAVASALTALLVGSTALADSGPIRPIRKPEISRYSVSKDKPGGEPELVMDRLNNTGWITGTTGCGKNAYITMHFKETRYLTHVSILPGLAGNNKMFKRHARPASVLIEWADGSQFFDLKDKRRKQRLKLDNLAKTKFLTITIDSTYNCNKDRSRQHGLAITEIIAWEPRDILGVDEELAGKITAAILALQSADAGEEELAAVASYGRNAGPLLRQQVRKEHPIGAPNCLAALARVDPKRAAKVATKLLRRKRSPRKVSIALKAMLRQPMEGLENELLLTTRNPDPLISAIALDLLAAAKHEEALPLLKKALTSGKATLLTVAIARLPGYGTAGREMGKELLRTGDTSTRLAVLSALGGFDNDEEAVEMLKPYSRGRDNLLRMAAIRSLGRNSSPFARMALEKLVNGKDQRAAEAALGAIILSGNDVSDLLEKLLGGGDTNARLARSLTKYMARTHTPEIRTILINAMTAELQPVWYPEAERALVAHGSAGVKALLKHLIEHPIHTARVAPFLRRTAKHSSSASLRTLRRLPSDRDLDGLREVLLEVLAEARAVHAADMVIKLYKDSGTSDRIRLVALKTLGYTPSPEAQELVLDAMTNPDTRISNLAVEAAGRMGADGAVPRLMERLNERRPQEWDPRVIKALGQLKAKQAVLEFKQHITYVRRPVKLAILRACKNIGGRDALKVLINASVSSDATVSRLAGNLLSDE